MNSQFFLEALEIGGKEFSVENFYRKVVNFCGEFLEKVLLSNELELYGMESMGDYFWDLYTKLVDANEKMKDELLDASHYCTKAVSLKIFIENLQSIKSIIDDIELDCCLYFDFEINNSLKEDLYFLDNFVN